MVTIRHLLPRQYLMGISCRTWRNVTYGVVSWTTISQGKSPNLDLSTKGRYVSTDRLLCNSPKKNPTSEEYRADHCFRARLYAITTESLSRGPSLRYGPSPPRMHQLSSGMQVKLIAWLDLPFRLRYSISSGPAFQGTLISTSLIEKEHDTSDQSRAMASDHD